MKLFPVENSFLILMLRVQQYAGKIARFISVRPKQETWRSSAIVESKNMAKKECQCQ